MKPKIILVAALAACVIVIVMVTREKPSAPAQRRPVKAERKTVLEEARDQPSPSPAPVVVDSARGGRLSPEPTSAPPQNAPQTQSAKPSDPIQAGSPAAAESRLAGQGAHLIDPKAMEQIGRVALSFVGADADAEEVWLWAINDPNLSANARKNLIEDLNEDGFPDPKNPTEDDLPLIESRIELIEEVAGDAMDEDNYAAFLEAYKDLVIMWLRLTQQ